MIILVETGNESSLQEGCGWKMAALKYYFVKPFLNSGKEWFHFLHPTYLSISFDGLWLAEKVNKRYFILSLSYHINQGWMTKVSDSRGGSNYKEINLISETLPKKI